MFWNGTSWTEEPAQATRSPQPSSKPARRRFRDWAATGVMGLALIGLIIPIFGASANDAKVPTTLKPWVSGYATKAYQESSGRIHYKGGTWTVVRHPSYAGGLARAALTRGSIASITFDGTGIAWIGPVGPTRGKANVYLDGKLVKVVNTHASRYEPTNVLYKATFDKPGHHRLTISVNGTSGHPTVAIDQFVVRVHSPRPSTPMRSQRAARRAAPASRVRSRRRRPLPPRHPPPHLPPKPRPRRPSRPRLRRPPRPRLRRPTRPPPRRRSRPPPRRRSRPPPRHRSRPRGDAGPGVGHHHRHRRLGRDLDRRDDPLDRQRGRDRTGGLRHHHRLRQQVRSGDVACLQHTRPDHRGPDRRHHLPLPRSLDDSVRCRARLRRSGLHHRGRGRQAGHDPRPDPHPPPPRPLSSAPTAVPTPTPTAVPTTAPTAAPTPTPPPSSLNRPFAAPVTSRTVNVPSSIDASGSSDAGPALNSFIAGVPDGSVITFPTNGVYKVSQGLYMRGRSNLVFQGTG